jgi:hypothetical protein
VNISFRGTYMGFARFFPVINSAFCEVGPDLGPVGRICHPAGYWDGGNRAIVAISLHE